MRDVAPSLVVRPLRPGDDVAAVQRALRRQFAAQHAYMGTVPRTRSRAELSSLVCAFAGGRFAGCVDLGRQSELR